MAPTTATPAAVPSVPTAGADPAIMAKGYVHPEVLVTTAWVADHLNDPKVRVLESDEDVLLYDTGHIPGAQKIDWHQDLNDPVVRDYLTREQFQSLLRRLGIDDTTTVVFYGDKNNWWATYAFWVFQLFGFTNARVMDGGRSKWEAEGRPSRPMCRAIRRRQYVARERSDASDPRLLRRGAAALAARASSVDVRSPQEFTRRAAAHAGLSAGRHAARRSHPGRARASPGHAPRIRMGHVQDGDRAHGDLRDRSRASSPADDVIAYCRIGERSSHTWFVLTYLLGYPRVRNYDGSWTEWGNAVRSPIEKGA